MLRVKWRKVRTTTWTRPCEQKSECRTYWKYCTHFFNSAWGKNDDMHVCMHNEFALRHSFFFFFLSDQPKEEEKRVPFPQNTHNYPKISGRELLPIANMFDHLPKAFAKKQLIGQQYAYLRKLCCSSIATCPQRRWTTLMCLHKARAVGGPTLHGGQRIWSRTDQ